MTNSCRLCGGPASHQFAAKVLNRFDVSYFRCTDCGSLQTDPPHWLDLAYSKGEARSIYDVGAVTRTRRTAAAALCTYRLAGLSGPILDFGGGSGLLCRMLRDAGLDARTFDEYADGGYAKGFHARPEEV